MFVRSLGLCYCLGAEGGKAQLVNACVPSVYSQFCTGAHMPETPLYRYVCLVRCDSGWSAGICSTLHYQLEFMNKSQPAVTGCVHET